MDERRNLGFYKHGNLPHLDISGAIQFVTFVLSDTAPGFQMRRNSLGIGIRDQAESALNDRLLDRGLGNCILRKSAIAKTVLRSVLLMDGVSHDTLAWVVMPNHVHLLLLQRRGHRFSRIVKQIKAGSTRNIRKLTDFDGSIWQRGYFDRMIRNPEHLRRTISYIHRNPVEAGLVNSPQGWRFSSYHTFDSAMTADRFRLPTDWFRME